MDTDRAAESVDHKQESIIHHGELNSATILSEKIPTCSTFNDQKPSGTFPADSAGNMQVCFPATTSDSESIATAVRQLPRQPASGGRKEAYDIIANSGMKVFFFQNQADAINYMQNTKPFSDYPLYAKAAADGVCGFTKLSGNGGLVTGIYKTCSYGGTNPDLDHTTKHEMGHAFDVVLSQTSTAGRPPSAAKGFSASTNPPDYLQDGLNKLTPSNWNGLTDSQKSDVVCGIFSNIESSTLEQAKGTPKGSVCTITGDTMKVNDQYKGLTPSEIAKKVAPYFLSGQEGWAEVFAVNAGVSVPPTPGFLQLSDRLFINDHFRCAGMNVNKYMTTGFPPTQSEINLHQCSFTPFDL